MELAESESKPQGDKYFDCREAPGVQRPVSISWPGKILVHRQSQSSIFSTLYRGDNVEVMFECHQYNSCEELQLHQ